MLFSQEFFSQEAALNHVVDWFNALPDASRIIGPNEMFLVRVKVVTTNSGEPEFAVYTTADPSFDDPSRVYLGECVFMWVGVREVVTTASVSSFYLLSKHISQTMNMFGVVGRLLIVPPTPEPETTLSRMGFGYADDSGWLYPITVGLTGEGVPVTMTDSWYMSGEIDMDDVTDVAVGNMFVVARKSDGTVWGWGHNWVVNIQSSAPIQLSVNGPVRRVAALNSYYVVLYTDGTMEGFGQIPEGAEVLPSLSEFTNVKDVKAAINWKYTSQGSAYTSPFRIDQYFTILKNDGSVYAWGATYDNMHDSYHTYQNQLVDVNMDGYGLTDVKEIFGTGRVGLAIHNSNHVTLWGDSAYMFNLNEVDFDVSTVRVADISRDGRLVLVPENLPDMIISARADPDTQNFSGWSYTTVETAEVVAISAGRAHHAILLDNNEVYQLDADGNVTQYPNVAGTVVQIFAGDHWSAAVTSDGMLHWLEIPQT